MTWLITPGQPVPLDPNISQVSLLLHGNGTNGSTTITDSSPSPKTVTAVGNAQISTAQSKFGGASIAFDGTGDFLAVPDSEAWNFLAADFTLECWVRINAALSEAKILMSQRSNDGNSDRGINFYITATGGLGFDLSTDGSGATVTATNSVLSTLTWQHVALARSGSTGRFFVDGILNATTVNFGSSSIFNSSSLFTIGGRGDGLRCLDGYIDDLRITKGVARYTANFTPPTAAFPDI